LGDLLYMQCQIEQLMSSICQASEVEWKELLTKGVTTGAIAALAVVPVGTTPEPEDSGRATETSLCMVKWIYRLVG
jgi:hypothetical protein